jgi:citrate lyase subunit beta / citryl-CoA lyase
LAEYARHVRSLGYDGMMAIHPSQVPIANAVFGPSNSEVKAARELVETFERVQREGKGAIKHEGGMIDYAHYQTAKVLLERADEFERRSKAN